MAMIGPRVIRESLPDYDSCAVFVLRGKVYEICFSEGRAGGRGLVGRAGLPGKGFSGAEGARRTSGPGLTRRRSALGAITARSRTVAPGTPGLDLAFAPAVFAERCWASRLPAPRTVALGFAVLPEWSRTRAAAAPGCPACRTIRRAICRTRAVALCFAVLPERSRSRAAVAPGCPECRTIPRPGAIWRTWADQWSRAIGRCFAVFRTALPVAEWLWAIGIAATLPGLAGGLSRARAAGAGARAEFSSKALTLALRRPCFSRLPIRTGQGTILGTMSGRRLLLPWRTLVRLRPRLPGRQFPARRPRPLASRLFWNSG